MDDSDRLGHLFHSRPGSRVEGRFGDPAARGQDAEASGRSGEVMRAIVQDTYGSADGLRLVEIDKPGVAANEVLVAAGEATEAGRRRAWPAGADRL